MTGTCAQSPVVPGMRAVVVGAGKSGLAAAELLCKLGAKVRLADRSADNVAPEARTAMAALDVEMLFGPHSADQFAGAGLVVLSPGVAVRNMRPYLPEAARVMAETELAWSCVRHIPVLAVTGTNGKTTTVRLCARMLEEAGKTVFLGGNIGIPLSRFVLDGKSADVLVLELSSFQLQTCEELRPHVAVLTNITVDHLDYHLDMQEYIDAKMRIFAHQTEEDVALLGPGLKEMPARYALRAQVGYISATGRFPQSSLRGAHNRLNMEAAFQACAEFGVTEEVAARAISGFSAAPHTLEIVGSVRGVTFVDDSKATTVDSLRVALEAFDGPIALLAGGVYKGGDLSSVNELLRQKVKAVGLYGRSREIFEAAWADVVELSYDTTMEAAARRLLDTLPSGGVLLLAPATSSFDQYSGYVARGDDFRRIHALLAGEE